MSEGHPHEPSDACPAGRRGQRRVRVRVRTRPNRSQRLKRWWRKHDNTIVFWGFLLVAVVALVVLVSTGQLRAPAPPPPD